MKIFPRPWDTQSKGYVRLWLLANLKHELCVAPVTLQSRYCRRNNWTDRLCGLLFGWACRWDFKCQNRAPFPVLLQYKADRIFFVFNSCLLASHPFVTGAFLTWFVLSAGVTSVMADSCFLNTNLSISGHLSVESVGAKFLMIWRQLRLWVV